MCSLCLFVSSARNSVLVEAMGVLKNLLIESVWRSDQNEAVLLIAQCIDVDRRCLME